MPSDTAVSVRDVSKDYRIRVGADRASTLGEELGGLSRRGFRRRPTETFHALRNATFGIASDEVLGITRSHGAGKSTRLKILSRITRPDRGVIDIFGRVGSL